MNKIICAVFPFIFFSINSFSQFSLNDSLKAYYPFNANALDESGNNNNATVFGASLGFDRNGNDLSAYSFDGISAFIDLGNDFDYPEKTISMWFYARSSNPNSSRVLYDADHPNIQNGYVKLRVIDNFGNKLRYTAGNGNTTFDQSTSLNHWYMLSLSNDGNNVKYYLDGQLIHSTSFSSPFAAPSGNPTVALGCSRIRDRFFDGLIDDVRIYNRVLSDSEIEAIYNLPLSITSIPASQGNILFPNPAQNSVIINLIDFTKAHEGQLKFYDSNGKIVINQIINNIEDKISVSDLENSLYFYEFILDNEVYRGKFIKK